MRLILSAAAASDAGSRAENEDSYLVLCGDRAPCGTLGLFAVADGMGGTGTGAAASQMAVQTLADVFPAACMVNEQKRMVDAWNLLRYSMQKANAAIYQAAEQNAELQGAGAACAAAAVVSNSLYIALVGGCRAYLLRKGRPSRLTEDEWVRKGEVTLVNQAVGLQPLLEPQMGRHAVEADDAFLLATDGLTEALPERHIEEILRRTRDPGAACRELLDRTLSVPAADNVTVLIVILEGMKDLPDVL